jgi:hypothetical protein
MEVAEHDPAAGPDGARELANRGRGVLEVRQGERAHRQVERAVLGRKIGQQALAEVRSRHALARPLQHRLGRVHSDDLVSKAGEHLRLPAGAARRVERTSRRDP